MTIEADNDKLVTVTEIVTEETETGRREVEVAKGETSVEELKVELGAPADSVLWLLRPDKRPRVLGDHERVDVKQGDAFEVLVRGGVS